MTDDNIQVSNNMKGCLVLFENDFISAKPGIQPTRT